MNNNIHAVIMAAGKGTRMKSQFPKVLQQLAGQPLLRHVLNSLKTLQPKTSIIITGHQQQLVQDFVQYYAKQIGLTNWHCTVQQPQLGTAHAAMQAIPLLPDDGICLILSGDVPLIKTQTLQTLVEQCNQQQMSLLTVKLDDPTGYGRILHNEQQQIVGIVEEKDATKQQKLINEVNSGIMAISASWLKQNLVKISNNNQQNEYYLTDIIALAVADNISVKSVLCADPIQLAGVNSPQQLAQLERQYQQQQALNLMQKGVRLADPARFDLRGELDCGKDVEIDINCIISGKVSLGNNVKIGANCIIKDTHIADNTVLAAFTHIEGTQQQPVIIGQNCKIGPFSRLRAGNELANEVHIGNFVELKNTKMGVASKANHLAYLGDALIGTKVNYGAGCITANYDGANKHQTVIEDEVHIGSNSVLVAPVTIGQGGTVGAATVVTKNTAKNSLTITRAPQRQREDWQRPKKIEK